MTPSNPGRARRQHAPEFKESLIRQCQVPGVSLAGVAIAAAINPTLLRRWVREENTMVLHNGCNSLANQATSRAPLPVDAQGVGSDICFIPVQMQPEPRAVAKAGVVASTPVVIEIKRGSAQIKVSWPVHAATECGQWLIELLR